MDDYKEHLRRLALHDDRLVRVIAGGNSGFTASVLDERVAALVRPRGEHRRRRGGLLVRADVTVALAAGATRDEIVATLEAVTPAIGAARVVACAPKVALALGYDVEAALEQLDP